VAQVAGGGQTVVQPPPGLQSAAHALAPPPMAKQIGAPGAKQQDAVKPLLESLQPCIAEPG